MKPLVLPLLLLVIASAAHGSADSEAMDEQAAEEVAFFQSMLGATIQQGQEILSAIEQHMSKLQDDGGDPREQEIEDPLLQNDGSDQAIEDPLSESQDDQDDGDELSKQGNEDSFSEAQDNKDDLSKEDRLVGVQDGDSDGLNDLTDAQDDDDEDAVDIQALQSILKDTQESKSDARAKRAAEKQVPIAKAQWRWTRWRAFNNHQGHYYNAFVNVARKYMRYNYNNKRYYESLLRRHMDRSYNNFIARMNRYFGSLYKKIEEYIPRYVKNPKDTKTLLKELSSGGKKLSKKAFVLEEHSTKSTSKVPKKGKSRKG